MSQCYGIDVPTAESLARLPWATSFFYALGLRRRFRRMEMAEPVKIRELKHVDPVLNLLEPEARAILAAQGIKLDPERPPKPYDFFELVSRVVYGSDEIVKHPFGALLFARYDDAEAACRNPALGAMGLAGILASGIDAGPLYEVFSSLMFSADGAEHQRLAAQLGRRQQ